MPSRFNALPSYRIHEASGSPCTMNKSVKKPLKDYNISGESHQSNLPYPYQEVEYLQSNGNQYINTGFIPNNNSSIEVEYEVTSNTVSKFLFGSRTAESSANKFANYVYGPPTVTYPMFGVEATIIRDIVPLNVFTTCKLDKNLYYQDGVLQHTFTEQTFTSTLSIFLFALNQNGVAESRKFNGKIKSCKIWDNGVLSRNMKPCYNKLTNVIGMYDTVNNVFYTNAGTGTFVKGADIVPTPDNPIPVVSLGENSKNLFENTGYTVSSNRGTVELLDNGFELTNTHGAGYVCAQKNIYLKAGTYTFQRKWEVTSGKINAYSGDVSSNVSGSIVSLTSPSNNSATFTVQTDGNYNFYLYTSERSNLGALGDKIKFYDIQLEQGSTATEYKPHNYIDVGISGKNVIPMNGGNYVLGGSLILYSKQNPNIPAGTYTVSCKIDSSNLSTGAGAYIRANLYNADGSVTFRGGNSIMGGNIGYSKITFEYDGINNILFDMTRKGSVTGDTAIVSEPMLELGSERTSYEPYQTPILQTIDLAGHELLKAIGDVSDSIDYKNQRIVRNIMELVCTGNEGWALTGATSETYQGFALSSSDYNVANKTVAIKSNKLVYSNVETVTNSCSQINSAFGLRVVIATDIVPNKTVAEWKAYLTQQYSAGTPVIIYYQLATPTYEPITLEEMSNLKYTSIMTANDELLSASNIQCDYYKQ